MLHFTADRGHPKSRYSTACRDLHMECEKEFAMNLQFDESTRGPMMSGTTGNRIWKYQMPVSEKFEMKLPKGAQIIRMAGEGGMLWLWAVVDTSAPDEVRVFEAFKAGGTMPDDMSMHEFVGMAHIYIQQELMLYIFEVHSHA